MGTTEPWQPYCGAEYPAEKVAGDPVICDELPRHDIGSGELLPGLGLAGSIGTKHRNSELGFAWW